MKRTALIVALICVAIVSVSAQGMGPGMGPGMPAPVNPSTQAANQPLVKIEGKLALVQGHPAIVVKTDTYFIRLPAFLYGFLGELKEGAQVKLEGYATSVPYAQNSYFFTATKLTLAGKDYDLTQLYANRTAMQGQMMKKGGRW